MTEDNEIGGNQMTKTDFETLKLQREKAEINGKIDALTIRRDAIEHKLAEIRSRVIP